MFVPEVLVPLSYAKNTPAILYMNSALLPSSASMADTLKTMTGGFTFSKAYISREDVNIGLLSFTSVTLIAR